jgi:hypothetical protein
MDPSCNLDSFFQYDTSMTSNDVQDNPSPHLTPNYDTSQQPPGAEVAGHATFTFPGQAEPSLQNPLPQGHITLEEEASRILTQFPVNFQSHEQEAGIYPPSTPSSDSSSSSHASQLRASVPGTFLFLSWVTLLRCELSPLELIIPNAQYLGKSIPASQSNPLSLIFSASLDVHARNSCARESRHGRTRTSSRLPKVTTHHPPTRAGSPYPLRTAGSWLARNT